MLTTDSWGGMVTVSPRREKGEPMKIDTIVAKRNVMLNGKPFAFGDEIPWAEAGLTMQEARYLANIGKIALVEVDPKAEAEKAAEEARAKAEAQKAAEEAKAEAEKAAEEARAKKETADSKAAKGAEKR
jgi:hypothetical protein